jgi:hippurate hydrolase
MTATKSLLSSGALILAASLAMAPAAHAADVAGTRALIDRGLDAQYSHIEALYKDIHSHPELGFQETRTAAKLVQEMRALGYEVTEGVGKTGIVALYKNGPGPTVMVRTELDALPMPEKTGLAYASTAKQIWRNVETPVAHSCGHDIHMAVWVAVAKTLMDMKDQWSGDGHVRRPAGGRG